MPGRSPYEAFQAFVGPLQSALGCVAVVKLEASPGGKAVLGQPHRLYVNGDRFFRLAGARRLEMRMRMRYEIIRDEREGYGPYRITTRAYMYTLRTADREAVLDYHWHPGGLSDEDHPHLHIGAAQLRPDAVLTSKEHVLTSRVALEAVVRTAVELGAEPLCADWRDRLALSEAAFLLHRSWR